MDETRLTGNWLLISRLVWVVLAMLYLGANLVILPAKISEPVHVQTLINSDWTTAETRAAFSELGLTPEGFGLGTRWINQVVIFAYFAMSFFLFLRKGNERMTYLLSVTFMTSLGTGSFEKLATIYSQPAWNTVELLSNSAD